MRGSLAQRASHLRDALDFIARGGDNYEGFKGLPQTKDLNIIRETMKDHFLKRIDDHNPVVFEGKVDDRWKNETAELGPPAH